MKITRIRITDIFVFLALITFCTAIALTVEGIYIFFPGSLFFMSMAVFTCLHIDSSDTEQTVKETVKQLLIEDENYQVELQAALKKAEILQSRNDELPAKIKSEGG